MTEHELIQPIVVDDQNVLVAGYRRLQAAKLLRWDMIRVRRYKDLSTKERLAIELEENVQRKELTPFEASEAAVGAARLAREVALVEFRGDSPRNPGRPQGGRKGAARRIGISEKSIREAERHVALAGQYTFMKESAWKQAHVIAAGDMLQKLPDTERDVVLQLIDGCEPETSLTRLRNFSTLPTDERAEIIRAARSENPGERAAATARIEAPIDRRIVLLREASRMLRRAGQQPCEAPEALEIGELADRVDALAQRIQTCCSAAQAPSSE
jgi:hypothetical protein